MKRPRHLKSVVLFGSAIALAGGTLGGIPGVAIAQGLQLNLPPLSAPGNRESGSTRSPVSCLTNPNEAVYALMPDTNYGLTATGYPSFYFYLPETQVQLVRFVVYEEATGNLFYEGQFNIKGDAGIVNLQLPENGIQRPLAVGESYYWYFSVICDPNNADADYVVSGTIQRVEAPADLSDALSAAVPADLPNLYAQAGLWHDALMASAQLRASGETAAPWQSLLAAVNLDRFASQPMLSDGLEPDMVGATP